MSGDDEPSWYLECPSDTDQRVWRVPLVRRPFRVGRRPGVELTLTSSSVSNDHAEIEHDVDVVKVRDLGSTNGTYLNREKVVGEAELREGDVVHFADVEFRLVRGRSIVEPDEVTMALQSISLPPRELENARRMGEMLVDRRVTPFFQPIVAMADGVCQGYEALGRGALEGLPVEPVKLFQIAAPLELETRLSEVFRSRAVEEARRLGPVPLFLNTHPNELDDQEALASSLHALREQALDQHLVLEIHERSIANPAAIVRLKETLRELDIELAYDDFGAGQARLLELADVPPDYLKFDIRLVRGIDTAPRSRRLLLASIVALAAEQGVRTIAEGIETQGEAGVCLELGFTHAQGFHYGRPEPLAAA